MEKIINLLKSFSLSSKILADPPLLKQGPGVVAQVLLDEG